METTWVLHLDNLREAYPPVSIPAIVSGPNREWVIGRVVMGSCLVGMPYLLFKGNELMVILRSNM